MVKITVRVRISVIVRVMVRMRSENGACDVYFPVPGTEINRVPSPYSGGKA